MTLVLVILVVCMLMGLFSIGGFLWSAMDGKPKSIWLIGAGVAIIVGLAGLVFHKG